ncbi:tRNA:m4X modification enzyme [Linderina pennispora]|nr:tRNA:m4X modification enzyme [Linderina pennispora]
MDQRGMLNPEFCFVEFGAGKGELSVYVHSVLETRRKAGNTIVLVDRQNARRKFQIIQEDPGQEKSAHDHFHRILIDIRDLDLGQIKELQFVDEATGQTRLRPIVAYSKHLCGAATDLTIKCLENYQNAGGKVAGMAIALCCHQVCKYSMMLDHDYLSQAIPRTQPDNDNAWDNGQRELFYRLTSMSSWAINVPAQLSDAKQDPSLFTQDSRTRIGHAIKRFIDIGRVQYVRQHLGLPNAELVYYAPRATSPENLMLVATGDACF